MSKYADEWQAHVAEKFPITMWLGDQSHVDNAMLWVTYWRRNLHKFAQDYLGIKLYMYQQLMLYMIGLSIRFIGAAARSAAKTFIIALFACCKAILYPGSQIVIASGTKSQAQNIITQKIQIELCGMSPVLCAEIAQISHNNQDTFVRFHNGSTIRVVVASDNARGGRSTVMIYEECRMVGKQVIDQILSPYSIIRQVPYIKLPQYEKIPELHEEPQEIYISSSWFFDHWFGKLCKDTFDDMVDGGDNCILAFDYSVTLRHNIKTRRFLENAKATTDEISWAIEYENQFPRENSAAYFPYELITKCQTLINVFYPRRQGKVGKWKSNIPKTDGEIRVLTCDIAMMGGDENDNSVYHCLRLLPESSASDDVNAFGYRIQVPYIETHNGSDTLAQTIRIKQLEADFEADYIVLDARSFGISVYDTGARTLYDPERGIEYPPWRCANNKEIADHVHATGAKENLYAFLGNVRVNNDIAVATREMMVNGRLELPVTPAVAEETLVQIPEYNTTDDEFTVRYYRHTYMESSLLAAEMAGLRYEKMEQTGMVRLSEASGARKDRYVSLAMGVNFAKELSRDLNRPKQVDYSHIPSMVTSLDDYFM